MEYSEFDTIGVFSAIQKVSHETSVIEANCEYVMDLSNKWSKFYLNGVLDTESELTSLLFPGFGIIIQP
jgi:hypothetical protein